MIDEGQGSQFSVQESGTRVRNEDPCSRLLNWNQGCSSAAN